MASDPRAWLDGGVAGVRSPSWSSASERSTFGADSKQGGKVGALMKRIGSNKCEKHWRAALAEFVQRR